MAQKIVIDIVAETQKLKQGIDEAGGQLNTLDGKLKGLAATAGAAASAFVLKQGVTFLKQGIDEAKEAKETMTAANTTFGEGSAVLQKITADAEKFGKEIAVDNDTILQLATALGSRLPADAKSLSAELVNLGFDVQAYTGGAIDAETMTGKLAKALADGELKATDLQKIVPDLSDSVYKQAEAASKAGDNQKALNIVIDAAQKKYGDAAEKNVTSTQKFDKALADLKEQIGTKVLPIVEKFINALTFVIEKFSALPTPVQNFIIGLTALIAIGGPFLTFLASAKTALITLGIVKGTTTAATGALTTATAASTAATTASTVATTLLTVAMYALPIMAVVGLIILLVKNWDTVVDVLKNVFSAVADFVPKVVAKVRELAGKVGEFVGDIIQAYLSIPSKMLDIGKNIVMGLWNGMVSLTGWFKDKILGFFGGIMPSWVKKALGISSPSKVFAGIGKNINSGLWKGLQTDKSKLKSDIQFYFGNLLPSWVKDSLQIQSPSKKFEKLGLQTAAGFRKGINKVTVQKMFGGNSVFDKNWNPITSNFQLNPPMTVTAGRRSLNEPQKIIINAGLGTDPIALGREVQKAIKTYGRYNIV